MVYTKETDVKIYETTDYDKFIFLDMNRKLTNNQCLYDVIQDYNVLKYNPIIVTSKFEVLDGQHRLMVAKQLEVPIFYVINTDHEVTIVQKLNIASKKWDLSDHLHFFISQNIREYVFFKEVLKLSPINPSNLIKLFTKGDTKSLSKFFKDGKLRFRFNEAKTKLSILQFNEVNEKLKYFDSGRTSSRVMQAALLKLILREEYDHNRFLNRIAKNPDDLIKANYFNNEGNISTILLDKIYNKNFLKKNHITYDD